MPRYCRLPKSRSIVVGVTPSGVDNALPSASGLERPMNQRSVIYLIVLSQIPKSDVHGVICVAQSVILHMRAESSGIFRACLVTLVPAWPTLSKGMPGLVRQQSSYTMRVNAPNSTLAVVDRRSQRLLFVYSYSVVVSRCPVREKIPVVGHTVCLH
ncbi:hypothetical protein BJX62DRAFT_96107 [Aspergillus germanicus]